MPCEDQPGGTKPVDLSSLVQAIAHLGRQLQAIAEAAGATQTALPHSLSLPHPDAKPLVKAFNEYLVYQARLDRSDRYLRQLRVVFNSVLRGRSSCNVHDLTASAVSLWIEKAHWSQRTRRGYLNDLRTFLAWCQRRGWCPTNVAQDVRVPRIIDTRAPAIHTPEEVRRVLDAARAADPDVCRQLAIRYFAGLRTQEAMILREEDVRRDESIIVVPASKAKTRRRRIVTIPPNLHAWLDLGGQLRGMRPQTIRLIVRASGVSWPPNVSRHSWCSYHLAQGQNAARTALEAGHDEAVLFAHYRALVTPSAAKEYWAIFPRA